jgi:hypothetical protein
LKGDGAGFSVFKHNFDHNNIKNPLMHFIFNPKFVSRENDIVGIKVLARFQFSYRYSVPEKGSLLKNWVFLDFLI